MGIPIPQQVAQILTSEDVPQQRNTTVLYAQLENTFKTIQEIEHDLHQGDQIISNLQAQITRAREHQTKLRQDRDEQIRAQQQIKRQLEEVEKQEQNIDPAPSKNKISIAT